MSEEGSPSTESSMLAKVLVFGLNGDKESTTQFYDAEKDTWSPTMAKENDSCTFNYDMMAVCREGDHKVYFTEHVDAFTDNPNLKLFVYDTVAGQIHQQDNLSDPPVLGNGAILGEHFYMAGGQNQALAPVLEVKKYDVEGGKWTSVAEILEPHLCPGMAVLNGQLYIVGSMVFELEEANGICQRYDPTANEWFIVAQVPGPLSRPLVVTTHEGKLFAVEQNSLMKLYVYTSEKDEWEVIETNQADTPAEGATIQQTESSHIVSSGGHLVVIDERCCVFKYNKEEASWTKGTDHPPDLKNVCKAVATYTE